MDPNLDFDTVFNQVIDECFEDNPAKDVIRLIRDAQQAENNARTKKRRTVINQSREEGHNRLFNDYFSANPINTSNVFYKVFEGEAPTIQYMVNRTPYNMGYYLADGIYLEWATFVKTIPMPQGEKRKLFAKRQESVRKDVEQAFGVLQSRFAIVRGPSRSWHMNTMKQIMYACIIMHNMIVEDERDTYAGNFDYYNLDDDNSTIEVSNGPSPYFLSTFTQRFAHMHQKQQHRQLQADLVEHIWEHFGYENNED